MGLQIPFDWTPPYKRKNNKSQSTDSIESNSSLSIKPVVVVVFKKYFWQRSILQSVIKSCLRMNTEKTVLLVVGYCLQFKKNKIK